MSAENRCQCFVAVKTAYRHWQTDLTADGDLRLGGGLPPTAVRPLLTDTPPYHYIIITTATVHTVTSATRIWAPLTFVVFSTSLCVMPLIYKPVAIHNHTYTGYTGHISATIGAPPGAHPPFCRRTASSTNPCQTHQANKGSHLVRGKETAPFTPSRAP